MVGLIIVAAVLLVLTWACVLALGLPIAIALVATAVLAALVVGLVFWRRHKAHVAAREIEKAIAAQADAQAQTTRPDQQAEIQAMQAQFAKAVAALKGSKLARGGSDALAVLPWYVIIGPPGAGKSTALRNSGLNFPYLTARGGVRGTGGTRNCEWWLTNEAVVLDTAGRYTTQEEDRDEWMSFLDTLARTRSNKPINGILAAVSVADLGGETEDGVAELAARVRERIDEVMQRLQVVVPVYLLFTKCDLVPGFVESFGDLRKNERGQMWGFTVPISEAEATGQGGGPGELFRARFAELLAAVEARSLKRLGEERQATARERIYQFPQEVAVLEANLTGFVDRLFADNVYQDTPIMRGVYFTSGTQEGRTVDRVMARMAEAFGVQPPAAEREPVLEAKSYFLRDVFKKVIFPDERLAHRSTRALGREAMRRNVLAAAGAAVALGLVSLPLVAFLKNLALVRSTGAIVDAAGETLKKGPLTVEQLEPMRARLAELVRAREQGPALGMRFGMYKGEELLDPLQKLYAKAVRRSVLDPVFRQHVEELESFAKRYGSLQTQPSLGENARQLARLKLHLLLTAPRALNEPQLGDAEIAFVAKQVTDAWSTRWSPRSDPAAPALVSANAEMFARLLAADPSLALPRYEDLVRQVRAVLALTPMAQLAIDKIVAEVEPRGFDVTLTTMMGGPVPALASEGRVRGAFTRRGYEEVVKDRLETSDLTADLWVVAATSASPGKDGGGGGGGDGGGEALQQLERQRLRSRYFAMYIDEWRRFLESISVETSGTQDKSRALALLQDLTHGEPPPLVRVFQSVGYNSRLGGAMDAALETAGKGVLDKLSKALGASGTGKAVTAMAGAAAGRAGDREEVLLTPADVERAFAGFARFGWTDPAAAGGGVVAALGGAGAGGGGGGGAPSPGQRHLPIDDYQERLAFVRDALQTLLDNEDEAPLLEQVTTARTRIRSLVDSQELGWRPRLASLLWPPIEAVTSTAQEEASGKLQQEWCAKVVKPYKQRLAGRYPFNRDGDDAVLADLAQFYNPEGGDLWGFVRESLKNEVQPAGEGFRFATRMGEKGGALRPELLVFLARSKEISDLLFPSGAKDPAVQFVVHVRPTPRVAAVWLDVDGQKIDYRNGPEEWHRFNWPGKGSAVGAVLRVRDVENREETVQQDGEWGLFRLLEAGKLRAEGAGKDFAVVWTLPALNNTSTIDFRPVRAASPFLGGPQPAAAAARALLRSFRVPGVAPPTLIAKGGKGCEEP